MEEFNYPSYSQTLANIEILKSQVWEEYDGIDLKGYLKRTHLQITNITSYHSSFFLNTPIEFPFDFSFFRVRKYSEIRNDELRAEYSYPPACFTKDNLRANLKGHPVFYSSESPYVALLEFINNWQDEKNYRDETFVISCWKLKKGKSHLIAPYISEDLDKINDYTSLSTFSNEEFRKMAISNMKDDTIDAMRAMKNYLASLFVTDDARSISSYLGHSTLYNNPIKPPIFMFPSIKAEKGENNFALHPNFVDENLTLSHVWKLKVNSIVKIQDMMKFELEFSNAFGFNKNDYIQWTTIQSNIEKIKQQYKIDFRNEMELN